MTLLTLNPGTLFAGRYRIVRCIAQGGMGAVYEVIHLETERRRALKVMLPDMLHSQEMRDRFRQEARVTANIESEFLVDVFDAGIDDATKMPFLVMEMLRGEEVHKRLKRSGRFAPPEVITFLHQASLALDKTHRASIVHRDLKPGNLFITERDDGSPRVKVLDFGIAKLVAEGATTAEATRNLGTPVYMAPEQFHMGSKVSPASDIYALGMIAYTLLVGVPYWHDELQSGANVFAFAASAVLGPQESAVARALRKGVGLPAAFDPWFKRITSSDPTARFPTASSAVIALAEVFGVSLGMQRLPTLTHDTPSPFAPISTPTPSPRSDAVPSWPADPRSQKPSSLRSSTNAGAPSVPSVPSVPGVPSVSGPATGTGAQAAVSAPSSTHSPLPGVPPPSLPTPVPANVLISSNTPPGTPSVPPPFVPPQPSSTPTPAPMSPSAALQATARQSYPSIPFVPAIPAPDGPITNSGVLGITSSPPSAPGPITPISGPVPPSGGPLLQSGSPFTSTPISDDEPIAKRRPKPVILGVAAAIGILLIILFVFMSGGSSDTASTEGQPADSSTTSVAAQPPSGASIDTPASTTTQPATSASTASATPPPPTSGSSGSSASSASSAAPSSSASAKGGKSIKTGPGIKRPTIYTPD